MSGSYLRPQCSNAEAEDHNFVHEIMASKPEEQVQISSSGQRGSEVSIRCRANEYGKSGEDGATGKQPKYIQC